MRRLAFVLFFLSGGLALLYEVVWLRLLVLVFGSTQFAVTSVLTAVMAGLALGSLLFGRYVDSSRRNPLVLYAVLEVGIGLFAFAVPYLLDALSSLGLLISNRFIPSFYVASLVRFLLSLLVLVVPTTLMGGTLPVLSRFVTRREEEIGAAVGSLYAINRRLEIVGKTVGTVYAADTVGTIFGAVLGGFVILPLAGLQGGILVAVGGGLLLAALLTWGFPGWTMIRRSAALAAALLFVTLVAARPAWDPLVMNSGIYQYAPDLRGVALTADEFASLTHDDVELVYYEEGMTANVVVGRTRSTGNLWISINGKIDASSNRDLETQLLLGHLPMLLGRGSAADARQAVVIGYATGITTGAVTRHNPARVVAVEIEAAVLRASAFFDAFNHQPLSNPRVQSVEADGRSFLLADPVRYDAIISEPSSPWMTVAANLFTREFFEIGRSRLAPGGIFCQWIQLYGLPLDELRSLVKTFAAVFPHVTIFWGIRDQDIIVLGSETPLQIDLRSVDAVLAQPEVAGDLARIGVRRVEDLLAYYLMDDAEVRAFVGAARLNTDDNALIEFRAPLTMHSWARTRDANARLLHALVGDPLSHASGLAVEPTLQAEVYTNLAQAFYSKRMFSRAADAMRRAQELHPTNERAARLASYEAAAMQAVGSQ